ncbi:hypothetical protein GCM10017083_36050 [Thalassobaculum fulvum]|uniref:BrnA antitoxin of type II toxin-antitoxin system n=1 Tax=Thalassobaculum fulvum TaxID=1633335 RepID=A0A919CR64_9PROT|nr:BrnA antitoxin family protein [Thalassobaculum fulvum]GHD56195.1 hypothetical protein GCM10017083_36050 [Thalassobaculum fulvum]
MAGRRLTEEEQDALDALGDLPDDRIDTTDVPEVRDFSHAIRGALYRPIKQQLTLKLDADLVDWFKRHQIDGRSATEKGYQTRLNLALRLYVQQHDPEFGLSLTPTRDAVAGTSGRR